VSYRIPVTCPTMAVWSSGYIAIVNARDVS
jgi:hypothetical protein